MLIVLYTFYKRSKQEKINAFNKKVYAKTDFNLKIITLTPYLCSQIKQLCTIHPTYRQAGNEIMLFSRDVLK